MPAEKFWLACSVCGNYNYVTAKNKQNHQGKGKMTLQKYCPNDRKHTQHVETRLRD